MGKKCPDSKCGGEIIKREKPGAWTGMPDTEEVCTNAEYHLQIRVREILELGKKTAPP